MLLLHRRVEIGNNKKTKKYGLYEVACSFEEPKRIIKQKVKVCFTTVGNPVANSHPCMLLGRIISWPCKES